MLKEIFYKINFRSDLEEKVLLAFVIFILSMNFCLANTYENNPNYVYVTMNHGEDYYLYLASLNVQEYHLLHYQIKVKFVCVFDEYRNHSVRKSMLLKDITITPKKVFG